MCRTSFFGLAVTFVMVIGLAGLTWTPAVRSADVADDEVDAEKVLKAIKRGVQFLRDKENGNGHWEVDDISARVPGGETSLAMLALLNSGEVQPDDEIIERGLEYLRRLKPEYTYVVGLQTMVFAAAGQKKDVQLIEDNVKWLIDARVMAGNKLQGWTYQKRGRSPDRSNSQYALLGLHEAHRAGVQVPPEVWKSIQDFYLEKQLRGRRGIDGSWGYRQDAPEPRLTMTTAGICGLLIAGMELNRSREKYDEATGTASKCGEYDDNEPLRRGLEWIGDHFKIDFNDPFGPVYYNLYGIERTGRLTGERFLGRHDWYREGCEYLVHKQRPDGSWKGGQFDGWPVVSTSFALLFLGKGRTPVLISKLAHDPGDDWNNDRNDIRHLVEYASQKMFKGRPLAWQVFDAKRPDTDTAAARKRVLADLLQSPIVYFNGHQAPRFTPGERKLLEQYVENGGFILAEACCGDPRFDRGCRQLLNQLFQTDDDDTPLKKLRADHPIWRAHALVSPKDLDLPKKKFELWGIERGCKTVVVYSPQDLSCLWEANQFESGRGQLSFRLGGNIIAYATGMELPKPRLSKVEVIDDTGDAEKIPRGYLQVAQLRHEGDWQPAPRAMRRLMLYLRDKPHLDVVLETKPVIPGSAKVLDFKFLYMHGRNAFSFDKDEKAIANLGANLRTGGLLLADACCGKKAFDQSFRAFMAKVFPDRKLERIPLDDELFSEELNGKAIKTVRCRRERADGQGPEAQLHDVPPFLEGIKYNNRWVVIYSKYDLGCALEKAQSPDCLGHDYDSALKLASAAALYAIKR